MKIPAASRCISLPLLLMCEGNDNLHLLTSDTRQRLRVDLGDFERNTRYAEYDNFQVDSEGGIYRLVSLGTYSGTAGKCGVELPEDIASTSNVWSNERFKQK